MDYKIEWRDPDGFGDSTTYKSKQTALDWKKAVENGGGYDVVITRMGSTSKSKKKKPAKKKKKKSSSFKVGGAFNAGAGVTLSFLARSGKKFKRTFKSLESARRAKRGWMNKGGARPSLENGNYSYHRRNSSDSRMI